MGKRTKRLLSIITVCLSVMLTVNGSSVKAMSMKDTVGTNVNSVFDGVVKEYSDAKDLDAVNDGETPDVYLNEDNDCKFIDGSYTNIKVENEKDAVKSINSVKKLMKIDHPENELKVLTVNSTGDLVSYKLQQMHNNVPLYGREVVVVTDNEGNTTSVGGNYLENVNVDTTAKISKEDAKNYAAEVYGTDAKLNDGELTIYSLNDSQPTLCWKVLVEGTKDGSPYSLNSFIDATTGKVINEVSLLTKAQQGTGRDLKGQNRTFNINRRSFWFSSYYELFDTTRNIKIYNANSGEIPGNMMINNSTMWNDPAAVSAICNLAHTYDYYNNKLKRRSYDGNGAAIVASIHYKENYWSNGYDNAFWTPQYNQFVFGDGDKVFTPLTGAIDVIAHEFTHAVVERTANLQYQGQSGALNEAYADILGNIIEGKDDSQWLLGEDITKNGSPALRNMSNPEALGQPSKVGGRYYVNPSDINNDYGGVHTNSGILNHAAYLMWENGIKDKDKLAKLFYNSLYIMNSTATFQDCRIAVTSAANNLGMSSKEKEIINNAFDEVGISARTLNW